MTAAKKIQKETVNQTLIAQALPKEWVDKKGLSKFVSRRVMQRVYEELEGSRELTSKNVKNPTKWIRATFNRILAELDQPVVVISDEDTVVKICLAASEELVAKSISKNKKNVSHYYDQDFLTAMPDEAVTNVLNAFRREQNLPVEQRKLKTEARIKNTFITSLKNLHKDFTKMHYAQMRGAGRELLGTTSDTTNTEQGISSEEKVVANIHRHQLIDLLKGVQEKVKSSDDKKRISLLMFVVMGVDVKDAAKAVNFLVRDAEKEMAAACLLIRNFDNIFEAFEDFREIAANEYDESLTSASSHIFEPTAKKTEPQRSPEPLFSFKPAGSKFNGSVKFWKNDQEITLNCINHQSITSAKEALKSLMNDFLAKGA